MEPAGEILSLVKIRLSLTTHDSQLPHSHSSPIHAKSYLQHPPKLLKLKGEGKWIRNYF